LKILLDIRGERGRFVVFRNWHGYFRKGVVMNSKARKHVRRQLEALTRPQLVALAAQKIPRGSLQNLRATDSAALIAKLIPVKEVLKPW